MTKIFFDANILVDLINKDNSLNKPITILFSKLDKAKKNFIAPPQLLQLPIIFYLKQ